MRHYTRWGEVCRTILAMAGLKHFILEFKELEFHTEDNGWKELFDPLQKLQIEKWEVEILGKYQEGLNECVQSLKDWIQTNGNNCWISKEICDEEVETEWYW
jgi:hypothetical protein